MINLIPNSARRLVIKEYWLRVLAVWLFLFGTGCLLVASLLLPTYMVLHYELQSLTAEVTANEVANTFDTNHKILTAAMTEAKLLNELATSSSYVADIDLLTDIAGQDVVLDTFSLVRGENQTAITITGIATTRSALADFRDAIETHPRFINATLPIASLIKDKNLDFSMTLVSLDVDNN